MHSLVDSWMYSEWESNLQPWHMGMILQPTEPPGQGIHQVVSNVYYIFTAMQDMQQILRSCL